LKVAEHLAGLGYGTSPREVRTWRIEGLLAKARRFPQGYARTVVSENAPGTFERAERLARLTGHKRMSTHERALTLFFEGEEVPLSLLHDAVFGYLIRMHGYVEKYLGTSGDPFEYQDRILELLRHANPRTKISRFLFRNVKDIGATYGGFTLDQVRQYLSSVLTVAMCFIMGVDVRPLAVGNIVEPDALDETVVASKLAGIAGRSDAAGALSEDEIREMDRDFIFSVYDGASLLDLAGSVYECSSDDLRWLCDLSRDIMATAQLRSRNERLLRVRQGTSGIAAAESLDIELFDYLYLALLVQHIIRVFDLPSRDEIARNIAQAMQGELDVKALLDAVGPRLHRILGAGEGLNHYPHASKEMLVLALEQFTEVNPETMARLRPKEESM